MIKFALIPLVIFSAAGAQILMKYSISLLSIDNLPLFDIFKGWHIYVSVGLYVIAFILTIYLFSVFELSFISPLLVGGVMLFIFLAGFFWGESITVTRVIGGVFLVLGMTLLTYSHS